MKEEKTYSKVSIVRPGNIIYNGWEIGYSKVPNKRTGPNKHTGWKILKKQ